ncbi:MAG: MBL fold metallo-hydrolase [Pseudohongiellaceae bacterium]
MILEKITTPGLAHYSYFLAAGGKSAVIDPRRDIEVYLRLARDHGCSIDYIFETHRNEDLISGACALAEQTGATVLHGPNAAAEVKYAKVTTR